MASMIERINNPVSVTQEQIDTLLREGKQPVIQFHEASYSAALLKKIDSLCVLYGEALEVRFYDHGGTAFDANNLRYLPHVAKLSVDCLEQIENYQEIGKLQYLTSLSFGVYSFEEKSFLSLPNLKVLRELVIGPNHKKNIDLGYLSLYHDLEALFIAGHTKHISAVASLPKLRKLSLSSLPKKQNLDFVNEIATLDSLMLILGGRESFEQVVNPHLKKIQLIRVRGLESVGDLSRFPLLTDLHIEDQIKLKQLGFSKPLNQLEQIEILNCKNLTRLSALNELKNLCTLRIYGTAIDFDDVLAAGLPRSLNVFAFYTGAMKRDKEIRTILDDRGFRTSDSTTRQ